mmetsp:Transcript_36105/g.46531  ORF Transcript_36105/g.46531 Transcript_36105/m.46531 type:complete len:600 (+) Transcript_36105:86-1885(+)
MGAAVSVIDSLMPKRKYRGGLTVNEFFDEDIWPQNREVLEILNLSRVQSKTIFDAFVAVDVDCSGEMTIKEFHTYLGAPQTKFSERIFGVLDLDGSGALDFNEFAVGVWNYCTYDIRLITKLAFDIFDVDRCGRLETCECDALLRMVYDVEKLEDIEGPPSGEALLEEIDVNGDGDVTIDEFLDLMESHMYILAPAFDLQRALRQRILGVKFWEAEVRVRQALFAGYDTANNDSWEAIQRILIEGKELREELEEEEQNRRELAMSEEELKASQRRRLLEDERKNRNASKILKQEETPEDMAESEAANELTAAMEAMEMAFIFEEIQFRVEAREKLYRAFDKANECAVLAREARRNLELSRAALGDAEVLTKKFLETEQGKQRLKYETQLQFGKEMTRSWTSKGGLQATLAPMFTAVDGKSVSVVAALGMTVVPKSSISSSKEVAYHTLLDESRDKLRSKATRSLARSAKKSEKEYASAYEDLVGVFGGPSTRWEKLWDQEANANYWYHRDFATTLWEEPALCHSCDTPIDNFDVKCFNCQTDRSKFNRRYYNGPSILPELPDEELSDDSGSESEDDVDQRAEEEDDDQEEDDEDDEDAN